MAKVLLADDDRSLLESVSAWLEHQKWTVDQASGGAKAREYMTQIQYDVLVVDWSMPEITGIELCQWHRSCGGLTPILILSGKDAVTDKERGLDSGADDYLTKPFEMRELTARLNTLLRRTTAILGSGAKIGPISMDSTTHKVFIDSKELKLTATEFSVLEFLGRHPNQVFSAEALIARVWKPPSNVSVETVRVYVKRLREKLNECGYPKLLVNVHGVGYKFDISETK